AQRRLRGAIDITYVRADYFDAFPKPCMNGWGHQFLTVTPNGKVLPCPAAAAITPLHLYNVRDTELAEIWHRSPSFQAYRGTAWMGEPCRSCERRDIDFGGCRCQAFLLTGDAAVTDPGCSLSPHRSIVAAIVEGDGETAMRPIPRRMYPGQLETAPP